MQSSDIIKSEEIRKIPIRKSSAFNKLFNNMHEILAEIEDEKGYRFYVNSATKVKYKENPQLILIIKKIKANTDAKYQTYRTAVKLIQLKTLLYSEYEYPITSEKPNTDFMLILVLFCYCLHFSVLHSISLRNFHHLKA